MAGNVLLVNLGRGYQEDRGGREMGCKPSNVRGVSEVWAEHQQCLLQLYITCYSTWFADELFQSSIPNLLNQNLHFNKIPFLFLYTLIFVEE